MGDLFWYSVAAVAALSTISIPLYLRALTHKADVTNARLCELLELLGSIREKQGDTFNLLFSRER